MSQFFFRLELATKMKKLTGDTKKMQNSGHNKMSETIQH